jgi:YVTN family beta-propeller protein
LRIEAPGREIQVVFPARLALPEDTRLSALKIMTLCLLCASTLAGTARAAGSASLLVLEKDALTLDIIDPASLKVLAKVPSGPDPHEVVASSDGATAYISNYGGDGGTLNTLSVVDLVARKSLPPVSLGALHSPHGLDFAGGKVYFTAESAKVIGRYDPGSRSVDWVLGTGQDRTHMVLVAKDLQHLYTTNVGSATVSFIEAREQRLGPPAPPGAAPSTASPPPAGPAPRTVWQTTVVSAGQGAEGFDVSPDGRELWTGNAREGTVTVIDVVAKKVVATVPIPLAGANRLKFTADGRRVLITGLGSFPRPSTHTGPDLVVLDASTRQVVKQLDLGGGAAGILLDPERPRAFIAVSYAGKVAIIDLNRLELTGQIAPLGQPDGMAWAPAPR